MMKCALTICYASQVRKGLHPLTPKPKKTGITLSPFFMLAQNPLAEMQDAPLSLHRLIVQVKELKMNAQD